MQFYLLRPVSGVVLLFFRTLFTLPRTAAAGLMRFLLVTRFSGLSKVLISMFSDPSSYVHRIGKDKVDFGISQAFIAF